MSNVQQNGTENEIEQIKKSISKWVKASQKKIRINKRQNRLKRIAKMQNFSQTKKIQNILQNILQNKIEQIKKEINLLQDKLEQSKKRQNLLQKRQDLLQNRLM